MPLRSRKKISIQGQFLCCRGRALATLPCPCRYLPCAPPQSTLNPPLTALARGLSFPRLLVFIILVVTTGTGLKGPGPELSPPALSSTLSPVQQLLTGGVGVRAGPGKGALWLVHRHPALPRQHPFSCPKFLSGQEGGGQAFLALVWSYPSSPWTKARRSPPLNQWPSGLFPRSRVQGTGLRMPFPTCPTSLQSGIQS